MTTRTKKTLQIGDRVTCKVRVNAYYSNYGGNQECWFEPGEVGIIGSINVPSVTRNRTFTCVDFTKYGKTWRCALLKDNIKHVK